MELPSIRISFDDRQEIAKRMDTGKTLYPTSITEPEIDILLHVMCRTLMDFQAVMGNVMTPDQESAHEAVKSRLRQAVSDRWTTVEDLDRIIRALSTTDGNAEAISLDPEFRDTLEPTLADLTMMDLLIEDEQSAD